MKTKQDFPSINERPPEGVRVDGTKVKVLVVDDSMFVAKQLGQILSSEGYEVVATAGDGKEGVDKYKELYPNVDVVTMDITMPRMDGITALEQIMAFDKDAKVVMVSALGKEELVKKSLMLGAKNYIVKPLDRKKGFGAHWSIYKIAKGPCRCIDTAFFIRKCPKKKRQLKTTVSLGDTGIEPVTPSVSCLYSNQLS